MGCAGAAVTSGSARRPQVAEGPRLQVSPGAGGWGEVGVAREGAGTGRGGSEPGHAKAPALSNYSHAFASNKTASRKQGCLFNCNQICRLRSAPPSPAQEPRAGRREEAQSRADPLHNGGRAGHWAWPHRASRSPGSISSAGGPASSARDGGAGGAEGEAWARTPSHTHADVPRFAWFLLLRGRGSTVLRSHRRAGVGGARVRGAPTSGSGTGRAAG